MTEKNWFDPNAYADMFKMQDFSKAFDAVKLPGVDAKALAEAHSKNLKAMMEANRIAAEGYQAVFKKQVEMVRANFEAATEQMREGASQPMNADSVKAVFEKAVKQMSELAEVVRKANEEAIAVVQSRFQEGVEEIKSLSTTFAAEVNAQTEKAMQQAQSAFNGDKAA